MLQQDLMDIIQLLVVILAPIVPAYLLFKVLPSRAIVHGPLRGFDIKLTGAFAGYFSLVLLIFVMYRVWHPSPSYQVWHVYGKVTFEQGNSVQMMGKTDIETHPRVIQTEPDGSFDVTVSTMPGPSGTVEFPELFFGNPEYKPQTIALDDPNDRRLQRIEKDHRINLNVELARIPPYNAGATASQQDQRAHP